MAQNSTTYKVSTTGPLAVTLAFFDAQQVAGHVLVTWETVSESNNAGLNLYRAASAVGPLTLLVYVPAQAPGSTQGAAHRYEDGDVQPGQTWWYTLEDVSLDGATTRHAPVVVTVGQPTAVGWLASPRPRPGRRWLRWPGPGCCAGATITPAGAGYLATLRLPYQDAELNGIPEADLRLWRQGDDRWETQGSQVVNPNENWGEQSDFTAFSTWTLASVNAGQGGRLYLPLVMR